MIDIISCSFRYQNTENESLSLPDMKINEGECIVLCGKSGCGKTTLTRLLNGLAPSFFNGEISGSCSTFGLKAGETAIEEYVTLVGSIFRIPKPSISMLIPLRSLRFLVKMRVCRLMKYADVLKSVQGNAELKNFLTAVYSSFREEKNSELLSLQPVCLNLSFLFLMSLPAILIIHL